MRHIKFFEDRIYEADAQDGIGASQNARAAKIDPTISAKMKSALLDEDVSTVKSSIEDLLIKSGFEDWRGKGYENASILYILRRTPTPSHLVMVAGENTQKKGDIFVDIFFDGFVEKKNHYPNEAAYAASPIPQIEKILGKGFDMTEDKNDKFSPKFMLSTDGVKPDQLKKVIDLYKKIKV